MPKLNIFVSFEFDKDRDIKDNFYKQAKERTPHRVRKCLLKEAYPNKKWKKKAKQAIAGCDVVIVLIGEDTHNAPGVRVEADMAHSLKKPVIQIRPQNRSYTGLTHLEEPIKWRWRSINAKLDEVSRRTH